MNIRLHLLCSMIFALYCQLLGWCLEITETRPKWCADTNKLKRWRCSKFLRETVTQEFLTIHRLQHYSVLINKHPVIMSLTMKSFNMLTSFLDFSTFQLFNFPIFLLFNFLIFLLFNFSP